MNIKPEKLAECFPLGDYLREEIQWYGWNVAEFAEHCYVHHDRMARIIEDGDNCTLNEVVKIAAALECSAEFLLRVQLTYLRWKNQQQQ